MPDAGYPQSLTLVRLTDGRARKNDADPPFDEPFEEPQI